MNTYGVLGLKIDDKLNFTEHISKVCVKAARKLHVFQCIDYYCMDISEPLFNKRADVLLQDLVKSRSHGIRV